MDNENETNNGQRSQQAELVAGVRYSLPAMLAEIRNERLTGSYAMEKLDQKEIGKLFKPQKRRR
ncbi:MAG: hypothetical protein WC378_14630, partial [Opitutaceae bacterium]